MPRLIVFFFLVLSGTCFAQDAKPKALADIIEANGKAIGLVATLDSDGNYGEKFACFFVSPDGVLVTSYQAIADADGLEVLLPDGKKIREVSVLSVDPRKDIAVLKVSALKLPAIVLGNSDQSRPGDTVMALSRPQGTFTHATPGIISAVRDSMRGLRLHQFSATPSQTGVGGPAINERGEVIGVVSLYRLFNDSLGFLIPINYVRGMLGEGAAVSYAEFAKTRKPFQPFDPAVIEAKRLAVLDRVKVSSFQFRDNRVKWEQIDEVTGKLRSELTKELNAYGSTAAEIFLADPFEVAEHRRLVTSLYFTFGEVFAIKDAPPNTLFPITGRLLAAAPPSAFAIEGSLSGKKGEPKGKVSKVTVAYGLLDFLPLLATGPNMAGYVVLASTLSRMTSNTEMPNLAISVFYKDVGDGKEKEAESLWSQDAYTVRWEEINGRRIWDLQEKIRAQKQQARLDKAKKT